MTDLIQSQLTDLFRIGLIVALVATMLRTQGTTGRLLPLAAGVLFVAVIIPSTMPQGEASLTEAVAAGVVSNLIILAIVLALWSAILRLRG